MGRLVLMDDPTSVSPVQMAQTRTNILLGETTGTFSVSVAWNENFATGYDSLEFVSTSRNRGIQSLARLGAVSHALQTTRPAGLPSCGPYINVLTELWRIPAQRAAWIGPNVRTSNEGQLFSCTKRGDWCGLHCAHRPIQMILPSLLVSPFEGWSGSIPQLRAIFSPAHPLARRNVPFSQATTKMVPPSLLILSLKGGLD